MFSHQSCYNSDNVIRRLIGRLRGAESCWFDIKDISFPLSPLPITSKANICSSWLVGVVLCCWYSRSQRFGSNLTGECSKVAVKRSSFSTLWGDFNYIFLYIQCGHGGGGVLGLPR